MLKQKKGFQPQLLNRARVLLSVTNLTIAEIAEGTGYSDRWIRGVRDKEIPDPSVNRIETLINYVLKN